MADAGVSELFKAYGAQAAAALKEHKDTEPTIYGSGLPPLEFTGVARLKSLEFMKAKDTGALVFRALGVIAYPQWVEGQFLEGCETKQIVVVDPTDVGSSIKQIMDHVKTCLGTDVFKTATDVFSYVPALDKIAKSKPVWFRVQTSKKDPAPNPRKPGEMYPSGVWERWKGNIPHFSPSGANGHVSTGAGGAVTTATAPANGAGPVPWGEAVRAKPVPVAPSVAPMPTEAMPRVAVPAPAPVSKTVVPPKSSPVETDDWALLIERARDNDAAADGKVRAQCVRLGKTEDEILEASWEEMSAWLTPATPTTNEGDTFPLNTGPEEGTTCLYLPPDPKDTTGATRQKRRVQCEVTELNDETRQMTLVKFSDRTKKWTGVSWDDPHVEYPRS